MNLIEALLSLKWWAIIGGVGIHIIFGMFWYGTIFTKQWVKSTNIPESEVAQGLHQSRFPAVILFAIVSTISLAIIFNIFEPQSFGSALGITLFIWFSFNAIPLWCHLVFDKRPKSIFYINGLYDLLALSATAVILQIAQR